MLIITTMIGVSMLIMGRQIFWVFIAGLGFGLSVIYGQRFYIGQPDWMILLIGVIIAMLGALLAYALERFAAGFAGFATGWYLTNLAFDYFGITLGKFDALAPIIVGILCALLIAAYYDGGIILLSSLAGAALIVNGINFSMRVEVALLISFALLGIAIQTIWSLQADSSW